jgi:hypothetical protein
MNKHFSNRLVAHSQGKETIMANVSKVILGAAIAAVSIASPALAAHKAKPIHQNGQFIRTDMSHKAVREAVFVLLPRYRVRLTIQRSPVAVALAIIKASASISGDVG